MVRPNKLGLVYISPQRVWTQEELDVFYKLFDSILFLNLENKLTLDDVRWLQEREFPKEKKVYFSVPADDKTDKFIRKNFTPDGFYYCHEALFTTLTPWKRFEEIRNLSTYYRAYGYEFIWIPCSFKKIYAPLAKLSIELLRPYFCTIYLQPNYYQKRYKRSHDNYLRTVNHCQKYGLGIEFEFDQNVFFGDKEMREKFRKRFIHQYHQMRKFKDVAFYCGYKELIALKRDHHDLYSLLIEI